MENDPIQDLLAMGDLSSKNKPENFLDSIKADTPAVVSTDLTGVSFIDTVKKPDIVEDEDEEWDEEF